MYSLKKKTYLNPCITALGLLLAIPSAYAAAPQVTYNETKVNFAPTYKMPLVYNSLAHDSHGNVLLLGTASGTGIDFDPGPGVDHRGRMFGKTFITKQNADGSYGGTTLLAGSENNTGQFQNIGESTTGPYKGVSIKVDANDNIYVLGASDNAINADFSSFYNRWRTTALEWRDVYSITPARMDLDPITIYNLNSSTHDTTSLPNWSVSSRGERLFVTKINAQRSQVVWSRIIGHDSGELLFSNEPLVVKPDGVVYIAGSFKGTLDFDPTTGSDVRTSTNTRATTGIPHPNYDRDAFITRLDADGSYASTKTSGKFYSPLLISATGGNLYLSGRIKSLTEFDPTNTFSMNFDASTAAVSAIFMTKLDTNDNPVWTRTYSETPSMIFTGPGYEAINIVPTHTGGAYIANRNYLTKVRDDGATLWTRTLATNVEGLAVDKAETLFVTGYYSADALDFDPSSSGSDVRTLSGLSDIYITAFDSNGNYGWTNTIGEPATDAGDNLMVVGQALYATGSFGAVGFVYPWITYVPGGPVPVDFNTGVGYDYKTPSPNGNPTTFLSKYNIASTVTVTARGAPVSGVYPTMVVRVDGQVAGTFTVTATNAPYVVTTPAAPGMSHSIDVVFTNDAGRPATASSPKEDRNLFVSSLRVNTTTLLPNSTGVTYDRGTGNAAFDGISVIAGQGSMWWNGALRFVVPAAAF